MNIRNLLPPMRRRYPIKDVGLLRVRWCYMRLPQDVRHILPLEGLARKSSSVLFSLTYPQRFAEPLAAGCFRRCRFIGGKRFTEKNTTARGHLVEAVFAQLSERHGFLIITAWRGNTIYILINRQRLDAKEAVKILVDSLKDLSVEPPA